jgi:hypothetical protein
MNPVMLTYCNLVRPDSLYCSHTLVLYSNYYPCGDGFACKPLTHEGLYITVRDDLPM